MLSKKNNNSEQGGFTLFETLIAMGIITMGLLGIMTLVVYNLKAQTFNKNYIIASMLAQEGLEFVRQVRDTNWMTNPLPGVFDGINGNGSDYTFTVSEGPTIDYTANSISDGRLYLKNDFYTHDNTGAPTSFYRLITVDNSGSNYLKINSWVQWTEGATTHNYKVDTYLYDWR